MAKLFGKADPTLTKMAYAAAAARAPGDYSEYYQSTVDSYKGLLGSIEKIAIQYEARNKAATEELDTAIGIFDDPLSAQIVDADFDDMQAEVNAQRDAWKANKGFKKDPEGLQAWNRKNQQILGRYDQDGSTLSTIAEGVKGKVYDTKGMKIEDKEFSTNIANYHANLDKQSGIYNKKTNDYITNNPNATAEEIWNNLGSDVKEGTLVKYKDVVTGEYTYISKVKNKAGDDIIKNSKSSDLLKLFEGYKKADDALISLRSVAENHRKIAVQTSKEYTGFSGSNKNAMIDVIDDALEKNPNALSYLSDKKIAGEEFTFKQALMQGKISLSNDIIKALGATKSDGDGVLEESDFATPENYQAVVDAILDGKATGVDTKKLFVDHLDSAIGKDHEQYKKLPPKEKGITAAMLKLEIEEEEKQAEKLRLQKLSTDVQQQIKDGETLVGDPGGRYAKLQEAKEVDGVMEPAYWAFYEKDKMLTTYPAGASDIIDELAKFVTESSTDPAIGTMRKVTKGPDKGKMSRYIGNGDYVIIETK